MIFDKANMRDSSCVRQHLRLEDCRSAGVKMKMLRPQRNGKSAGFPSLHCKTTCIDGELVLTGSLNPTHNGIDHNKEHLLATREKNVVAAVVEDFEKTWAAAEEITNDDLVTLATAAAKRKGSRQRSSSRSVSRSVSATSVEERAEGVYADGGS